MSMAQNFSFQILPPEIPTISSDLVALFKAAGADWQSPEYARSPKTNLSTGDNWLPNVFPKLVDKYAKRVEIDLETELRLLGTHLTIQLRPPSVKLKTVALTRSNDVIWRALSRRQACPFLLQYLQPLVRASPKGSFSTQAYECWLIELARSQWTVTGERDINVPYPVWLREQAYNNELIRRWGTDSPLSKARSRPERRFGFTESEPFYARIEQGTLERWRARRYETSRRQAAERPNPVVLFRRGRTAPANLYISEVATELQDYLELLEVVVRASDPGFALHTPLMNVAYGLLAVAVVPVFNLYESYHGTCVIENVIPDLHRCAKIMLPFVSGPLRDVVLDRVRARIGPNIDRETSKRVTKVLNQYKQWVEELQIKTIAAHHILARVAAKQGRGRVMTPSRFTANNLWIYPVECLRVNQEGEPETFLCQASENVFYASQRDSEENLEIWWILLSTWHPMATAAALINQSGMSFRFNAANNRWGGKHPPHKTHRRGASLDFDVGFAWRGPNHTVPNVKVRDDRGVPLSELDVSGNTERPDCLHGMNRIAGWVATQAFILTGISGYLYGDEALVEEAGHHLLKYWDISRPGRVSGIVEHKGHHDHWHFYLLPNRQLTVGPYSFRAKKKASKLSNEGDEEQNGEYNPFEYLRELAEKRDKDLLFWKTMTGKEMIPASEDDFNGLEGEEDWKQWWKWRNSDAGIPFLPVWDPELEPHTMGHDICLEPRFPPAPFYNDDEFPA